MSKTTRIIIAIAVVAVAALTFVAKQNKQAKPAATNATPAIATTTAKLPKLIDLGAGKCIPCKMMAPILEELKKEYAGRMNVEFIDLWENPDAGKPYGIEMIPTQIFFNADGKELFRHVGFFSKEDILAKWKELGVDLTGKLKSSTPAREEAAGRMNSAAKEPISDSTSGIMVDSLVEMNARGGDMNAVFLLIPATNDLSSVNWVPMNRAKRTLEAEWDISLGLFGLKPGSRDYQQIARRESMEGRPTVMIILQNGTVNVLSRELTESNLVQEFVYTVGVGGCCPLGDP